MRNITTVYLLLSLSFFSLLLGGCAAKKQQSPDNFGTQVNHPKFKGPIDFTRSLARVNKTIVLSLFRDGGLDPKFREQLCLVVTLNNHCVG